MFFHSAQMERVAADASLCADLSAKASGASGRLKLSQLATLRVERIEPAKVGVRGLDEATDDA